MKHVSLTKMGERLEELASATEAGATAAMSSPNCDMLRRRPIR